MSVSEVLLEFYLHEDTEKPMVKVTFICLVLYGYEFIRKERT
jgi:hypothetical protein